MRRVANFPGLIIPPDWCPVVILPFNFVDKNDNRSESFYAVLKNLTVVMIP